MSTHRAANDDTPLRLLIDGVGLSPDHDARDLPDRFCAVMAALDRLGLPALVIGRIAYARYAPAQYCAQIELLLPLAPDTPDWTPSVAALQTADAAACRPGSSVRLVLRAAVNAAERDLISASRRVAWLGAEARLATPAHLLARFLLERTDDGHSLAVQLAMACPIDPDVARHTAKHLGLAAGEIDAVLARADRDRAARWDPFHRRPTSNPR